MHQIIRELLCDALRALAGVAARCAWSWLPSGLRQLSHMLTALAQAVEAKKENGLMLSGVCLNPPGSVPTVPLDGRQSVHGVNLVPVAQLLVRKQVPWNTCN